MYSTSINNLIHAFKNLPTVGQKTAERFVFHLLKSGKQKVSELELSLKKLMENVKSCEKCWDFSDTSPCALCSDSRRGQDILCIVAEPQDIQSIEKTGEYQGLYFILRGTIQAHQENLGHLKIKELLNRLSKEKQIKEVVLALNPDIPGETTVLYLEKQIQQARPDIKITRPARGLPMGSDLQYADEITLGAAFKNRK
ncbi:MAG: recombination mediator RecR [bacterium]